MLNKIISINPKIRGGEPTFKNTRLPVAYVIGHLLRGWNIDEVVELFPEIKKSHILAVLKHMQERSFDEWKNTWTANA